MNEWIDIIEYREFCDVPRMFVVCVDGHVLLFDCPFDETLDEYRDEYRVYDLGQISIDTLPDDWTELSQFATRDKGSVAVGNVIFDNTKRKRVNVAVFAKIQPSVAFDQAIEFAVAEFRRGTRFWPRLITAYCEQVSSGAALQFAMSVYEDRVKHRGNDYVTSLLAELESLVHSHDAIDSTALRERSRQIWEDVSDTSIEKRGVTRLYNSLRHQVDHETDDYEVEITRSLGMIILDDAENPRLDEFEYVIKRFQESFDQ